MSIIATEREIGERRIKQADKLNPNEENYETKKRLLLETAKTHLTNAVEMQNEYEKSLNHLKQKHKENKK